MAIDMKRSMSRTVTVVTSMKDADVAVVLYRRPVHKVMHLLSAFPDLLIICPMTPHEFNDRRVYFMNSRMRDLSINVFVNTLCDLRGDITHVDIRMTNPEVNLESEVMEALSVVNMLHHLEDVSVRLTFNDNGVHASCADRSRNFTASCYVGVGDRFFEEISVFTKSHGKFTLGSDDTAPHTYAERYSGAWDTVVKEVRQRNRFYQKKITSKVKRSLNNDRGR